jgi:hypothetical protein
MATSSFFNDLLREFNRFFYIALDMKRRMPCP